MSTTTNTLDWMNIGRFLLWIIGIFSLMAILAKFNILGKDVSRIVWIVLSVLIFIIVNIIPVMLIVFLSKFISGMYKYAKTFMEETRNEYEQLTGMN